MSHFTKIKTSLKNLDILKTSLTDLGIIWDSSTPMLYGYKSSKQFVNLRIKQNNNYDIGFSWNGSEYQLVADLQFWQQAWSVNIFLDKLTQRYAYNSIVKVTNSQGFQTVEELKQANGIIKITMQRWS